MLTDDPNEDLDDLEPEVRPRFQHEWEAQQQGAPEAATEAAAPKRARGRASRGGKWQVRTRPLPYSLFWCRQRRVMPGDRDLGRPVISTTDIQSLQSRQMCTARMLQRSSLCLGALCSTSSRALLCPI